MGGVRRGEGVSVGAGIQLGQQVTLAHPCPLLKGHGLQAPWLAEGQLDLADIDVTEEHQVCRSLVGPAKEPPTGGGTGCQEDEERNTKGDGHVL